MGVIELLSASTWVQSSWLRSQLVSARVEGVGA